MPRRDLDQYFTPTGATETLMVCEPDIVRARSIIECCDGEGAISKVLRRMSPGVRLFTNDLHPLFSTSAHHDATYWPCWQEFPECDWVVTNPPFLVALPILQNAIRHARIGVAFLLRLSFLEPTDERGPWLSLNPPNKMIVLPRISFTGDGNTDNVTCAWMIWNRDPAPGGIRIIDKPRPARMLLDDIAEMERT